MRAFALARSGRQSRRGAASIRARRQRGAEGLSQEACARHGRPNRAYRDGQPAPIFHRPRAIQ